ncbi:hypothetical protein Tco_1238465 [Tanacetum coccineum]
MGHLRELGHGVVSTNVASQLLTYTKTKIDNDVKAEKDLLKVYDELSRRFKAQEDLITKLEKLRALWVGFTVVLAVLVTGASQSRQHGKIESDSYYLSD